MNRRRLIKGLTLVTLTGGISLIGTSRAEADVILATKRPGMAVGESIQYDAGLKLTFVKVRRDTRQPLTKSGTRSGSASVVLRAEFNNVLGNNPPRIYTIKTGDEGSSLAIRSWPPGFFGFKTYHVKLVSLTPIPKAGMEIKQSDYRLQLSISLAY